MLQLYHKSKFDCRFQWELFLVPIQQDFMCLTFNTCVIQLISVGLLKLKYLVESEPLCIHGYRLKY